MKTMILAYNPSYVNKDDMERLKDELIAQFNCYVIYITHYNPESKPLYCVQFVDSTKKD